MYHCLLVAALVWAGEGFPAKAPASRPHDPWVFRCVLDKNPRSIVVALHKDLWISYDARTCSLTKAWKGDVTFTGAVYDTLHGPQPLSKGKAYLASNPYEHEAIPTGDWVLITKDGQPLSMTPRYRGYRLHDGYVTLTYEIKTKDGTPIEIREIPEASSNGNGTVTLYRRYKISGLPEGWSLQHHMPRLTQQPSWKVEPAQAASPTTTQSITFSRNAEQTVSVTWSIPTESEGQ